MVDIDTVAGNFDGISYAKGASVLATISSSRWPRKLHCWIAKVLC